MQQHVQAGSMDCPAMLPVGRLINTNGLGAWRVRLPFPPCSPVDVRVAAAGRMLVEHGLLRPCCHTMEYGSITIELLSKVFSFLLVLYIM
jgi:hypothetical protein